MQTNQISTQARGLALSTHAHWILRLGFSAVYIPKGIEKLIDLNGFSEMMGLPFAVALLVALAELAGGLAVLAGGAPRLPHRDVLTRLGALATVPVILGAIIMVHWGQWSFVPSATHPMGGMEFQAVLLLLAGYFLVRGNRA